MNKIRFSSYSFGCRINHAEREEIDKQMIQAGFIYDDTHPDIFIINTCAVTKKAERETKQLIYRIKKKYSNTKIVATGCAVTYWQKNNLYSNLPIDLFVDNINKEFLVNLLLKRLLTPSKSNLTGSYQGKKTVQKPAIFDKFIASGRLLIKIQDGCYRFCSFCIVSYLRGLPKSIKIDDIISKINHLDGNIKEVILTAVNTEAYGYDTEESFTDLIRAVIERTKVPRISFGSIHPWSLNNDFFRLYSKMMPNNRLVDYFHIPLQSGSDKILNLMKRSYTGKEFIEKIHQLSKINSLAFIGTDVIVGFLEETDQDFEKTYQYLSNSPISKFHIFKFSKRINTAAYFMAKKLREPDHQTKVKRAKLLADLSQKKYEMFLQKQAGLNSSALFLNKRIENYQDALLQNQVPAYIKTKKDLTGEIKNVKIESIKDGKLFGKIV